MRPAVFEIYELKGRFPPSPVLAEDAGSNSPRQLAQLLNGELAAARQFVGRIEAKKAIDTAQHGRFVRGIQPGVFRRSEQFAEGDGVGGAEFGVRFHKSGAGGAVGCKGGRFVGRVHNDDGSAVRVLQGLRDLLGEVLVLDAHGGFLIGSGKHELLKLTTD